MEKISRSEEKSRGKLVACWFCSKYICQQRGHKGIVEEGYISCLSILAVVVVIIVIIVVIVVIVVIVIIIVVIIVVAFTNNFRA